jgi:aryl-alcohol dehydrogenase-like predicted oxidoreductase
LACVGDEAPLSFERRLQAAEHLVQGLAEPRYLVTPQVVVSAPPEAPAGTGGPWVVETPVRMPDTQLQTTKLGNTGLEITRVGFGAWAIGGAGYDWGWGPQEDDESIAAIHHALELGVNWIDTAAQYGFGHSEEVVGRALEGLEPRPHVFTKGGQPEGPGRTTVQSLERDSLRREAEASLERLGVDAIDLYQIHWPIPDAEIEEGWSTLAELKQEGLVHHIGVSNFGVDQLQRIQGIAPVETLQPGYSLIARGPEDAILPYAEREGIGVIVYSPMGSGLLTGRMSRERIESLPDDDWRRHDSRFQEPLLSGHLAIAARLQTVGERIGATPGAVAVAWTLANKAVDGAIVGFRRPDQVDPILPAAAIELSSDDLAEIEGRTRGK